MLKNLFSKVLRKRHWEDIDVDGRIILKGIGYENEGCILIYIEQDATLRSLFYLETALRVSGGTSTHHQKSKQLYLQRLVFVTALQLSAAIVEGFELV